jgi:hypothetical protein
MNFLAKITSSIQRKHEYTTIIVEHNKNLGCKFLSMVMNVLLFARRRRPSNIGLTCNGELARNLHDDFSRLRDKRHYQVEAFVRRFNSIAISFHYIDLLSIDFIDYCTYTVFMLCLIYLPYGIHRRIDRIHQTMMALILKKLKLFSMTKMPD